VVMGRHHETEVAERFEEGDSEVFCPRRFVMAIMAVSSEMRGVFRMRTMGRAVQLRLVVLTILAHSMVEKSGWVAWSRSRLGSCQACWKEASRWAMSCGVTGMPARGVGSPFWWRRAVSEVGQVVGFVGVVAVWGAAFLGADEVELTVWDQQSAQQVLDLLQTQLVQSVDGGEHEAVSFLELCGPALVAG